MNDLDLAMDWVLCVVVVAISHLVISAACVGWSV